MYAKYAERQGWKVEVLSSSAGEKGGYKEIISRIIGQGAYSRLKFESGAHRVQRVPETEAQGRMHTSTCTVAVLPEIEAIEEIKINPAEVREDTYRSSGAGGQHVNKTDSAVRLTHLPTGIVVECQDERSQHKNRARARSLLQAKLLDMERQKQTREQAAKRKSMVGTGDRSERIRTYNFPQGRLTDHRIDLTLYQLPDVIEGDLDPVIGPLAARVPGRAARGAGERQRVSFRTRTASAARRYPVSARSARRQGASEAPGQTANWSRWPGSAGRRRRGSSRAAGAGSS